MPVHNPQYRLSLLGFALLTTASLSQAQPITITKPQSSLGRELSNPFPVDDNVISMADVVAALGGNPMPSRFSHFELTVSLFPTELDTSGGMLGGSGGGMATFGVQLSNAMQDGVTTRNDPFAPPGNPIGFNYSFNDSSQDYGSGTQTIDVAVQAGNPLHAGSNAFLPVTFSGDISDVQSDSLLAALTTGYTDANNNLIQGFRPFIGSAGQSRYYRYDSGASYTLRLFATAAVPEPGVLALLGAAFVGSGIVLRRRRR